MPKSLSPSGAVSSLVASAQSIKAQSLATLMAAIDPVVAAAGTGGTEADNPKASLQTAAAAVKATLVSTTPEGKAVLDVAGARIETMLPPELLKAGAKNPDLLKPGTRITLPPDQPVRALPTPATTLDIHGQSTAASVGPARALASPFPPGSLGAAISRLAGIALPGAEPAVITPGALPAPPAVPPTLKPGMVSHAVSPEILTAVVQASGKQVPLAQGLNAMLSLPSEVVQTLPASVQGVLRALASARTTPEALSTPENLQKAITRSGAFMEAHLAALPGGAPAPPPDLKTLLLALKSLLAGGLDMPDHASPAPSGPEANSAGKPGSAHPVPPAGTELARLATGTLERLRLTQLASLPEHPEITFTDDRAQPTRVALSLPLAPHGQDRPATAVMGMVIEHRPIAEKPASEKPPPYEQDDEDSPETAGFPWKVRIALDLEETGPVQAQIALRGQCVGITLWAERKEMVEAARHQIGTLHDALSKAAFEVVKLEVKDGFPHQSGVRPAPILDRRT